MFTLKDIYMVEKTKSIVLYTIQYKDSMSIVHLYTEEIGRMVCFLPVSKSKKSLIKSNMFQPLAILDLEIEYKSGKEIHRLKEAKIAFPLNQIPYHPVKSAIALFIAELLYRVIGEHEQNQSLYRFVENAVRILELSDQGIANFHIVFLMKLTAYLGFYPNEDNRGGGIFDMVNGIFVTSKPLHNHCLSVEQSKVFGDLLRMNFENMGEYIFNRYERQDVIAVLLDYYRLHLTSFPVIKSLDVLKMLF